MADARSSAIGAFVGIGSRDESVEEAGVSHFLEHLAFKGTETRSAYDIAVSIDAVGGEMNAFTGREQTVFYCRLPAAACEMGVELLTDVLRQPALRPEDIDAERQVILEELHMALDYPDDRAQMLLYDVAFPGHALARDALGLPETVAQHDRDRIDGFHDRWYRGANIVVAAAGAVDHDDIVAAVEQSFGDVEAGAAPERVAPESWAEIRQVESCEGEQVHVNWAWQALARGDDRRHAFAVANQILGGGMSSRLFQEVREKRGLTYGISSGPVAFADTGMLTVTTAGAPERLDYLVEVVDAELQNIVENGFTEAEIATAKGFLEGSTVLGLEDAGGRMFRLGQSMLSHGQVLDLDEQLAKLDAVTAADAHDVMATVLSGPRVTAMVGPVA